MDYSEVVKVIETILKQHKNGYAITQSDYNRFLDAVAQLETIKKNIEVS